MTIPCDERRATATDAAAVRRARCTGGPCSDARPVCFVSRPFPFRLRRPTRRCCGRGARGRRAGAGIRARAGGGGAGDGEFAARVRQAAPAARDARGGTKSVRGDAVADGPWSRLASPVRCAWGQVSCLSRKSERATACDGPGGARALRLPHMESGGEALVGGGGGSPRTPASPASPPFTGLFGPAAAFPPFPLSSSRAAFSSIAQPPPLRGRQRTR
jgi:hypothetical protein